MRRTKQKEIMITLTLIFIITCIYYHFYFRYRSDGSINITYETIEDVKNEFSVQKVSFHSGKYLLHGAIYKQKNLIYPKATILMFHGLGTGHYYLMNIIRDFVNDGYQVFAYDRSGAALSEGPFIGDMTSCLYDAEMALEFIRLHPSLFNQPLYVFGHSMGGYTALASLLFKKYHIEKLICVAGFDSEKYLVKSYVKWLAPFIGLRTFLRHGKYALMSGRKALKTTQAEVLYLQGKEDKIVPTKYSGEIYQKIAKNKSNVNVILLPNKEHTPFLDDEAQKTQNDLYKNLGIGHGKTADPSLHYNYHQLSKNDPIIIKMMLDFYNN